MKYRTTLSGVLRKNTSPGIFIALEGLDGSGKSTLIPPLKDFFAKQGREVVTFHWPRKTEGLLAQLTRSHLKGTLKLPKPTIQYLFSADYVIYSEEVIIPALKAGKVVISDRCHFWSAIAYGSWENAGRFDEDVALSLLVAHGVTTKAYQFIIPDVTFYLDISIDTAMKRLAKKKVQKEIYEKRTILESVVEGYEWLTGEFPDAFIRIDAERSIGQVTQDMIHVVEQMKYKKQKGKEILK